MNNRQLFLKYLAQTSPEPINLEIVKAGGIFQYASDGKVYVDLISGFNVANIGHSHPKVVRAVQDQATAYMHLIVYGEFVEAPQISYAKLLTENLPPSLNCVYFTNSGAEATEGAMKLAKRSTGRSRMIAFHQSYHGSTQGALSLMGDEYYKEAFRPLLPDIQHYNYESWEAVEAIDANTACIILETVQAESGVRKPEMAWLQAIREKCDQTGALLILDEIQAGFGRTGSLWAFQQYNLVPDILLLGKALGGGMPLGAFISAKPLMDSLMSNPVLGHITTFGGHPVSCAAGKAALEVLLQSGDIARVGVAEEILVYYLRHPFIRKLRTAGLWASLEFENPDLTKRIIHRCIQNGLITDWFLFAPSCLRIAPPLCISEDELIASCLKVVRSIEETV